LCTVGVSKTGDDAYASLGSRIVWEEKVSNTRFITAATEVLNASYIVSLKPSENLLDYGFWKFAWVMLTVVLSVVATSKLVLAGYRLVGYLRSSRVVTAVVIICGFEIGSSLATILFAYDFFGVRGINSLPMYGLLLALCACLEIISTYVLATTFVSILGEIEGYEYKRRRNILLSAVLFVYLAAMAVRFANFRTVTKNVELMVVLVSSTIELLFAGVFFSSKRTALRILSVPSAQASSGSQSQQKADRIRIMSRFLYWVSGALVFWFASYFLFAVFLMANSCFFIVLLGAFLLATNVVGLLQILSFLPPGDSKYRQSSYGPGFLFGKISQ